MSKTKAIVMLLRLPFLTVTLGAIFVGTSFAYWQTGSFHLFHFILVLLGACFFHIATNVANDYFDFKSGNDAANISGTTPFSGGSRVVLEGLVKPETALMISVIFATVGSAMGLFLNFTLKGNTILFIGIAGLFFVYSYNGFPLQLVNKGLGEIGIFLAWGPLMVIGAYYAQTENLNSVWPLIVSIPSGLMTTLVLLINEFADEEADTSTGRKTWVILFGKQKSLLIYLILALSCYIVVLLGVVLKRFPIWSLLVWLTFPLAILAFSTARKTLGNWSAFLGSVKTTILMNFVFLVILSVSFLV
jgi:1,4-dihydroxy-2-naphthoate octaprenyltransferase